MSLLQNCQFIRVDAEFVCCTAHGNVLVLQLYISTSYLDDLMLAACWLNIVTDKPAYLHDAEQYWDRLSQDPNDTSRQTLIYNWDNAWWASNLLLWKQTGNQRYKARPRESA